MEFDLNQFDEQISRYTAIHAKNEGVSTTLGAQELSRTIVKAIIPLFPQLSVESPKAELDKIAYLCSKAVEFSPYLSARRIVQGQFFLQIGDFKNASASFMEAYNIEKDVVDYPWPYLQKTEINTALLLWMGNALYHAGEKDLGRKFFEAGKEWEKAKPSGPEPN